MFLILFLSQPHVRAWETSWINRNHPILVPMSLGEVDECRGGKARSHCTIYLLLQVISSIILNVFGSLVPMQYGSLPPSRPLLIYLFCITTRIVLLRFLYCPKKQGNLQYWFNTHPLSLGTLQCPKKQRNLQQWFLDIWYLDFLTSEFSCFARLGTLPIWFLFSIFQELFY